MRALEAFVGGWGFVEVGGGTGGEADPSKVGERGGAG